MNDVRTLSTMRLPITAVMALFMCSGAASQQVGAEDIALQMMVLIEQRLDTEGLRLTEDEKAFIAELVIRGAERIYERNALSEVVREADALADRIVQGYPTIAGVCPLPPFC